MKKPNPLRKNLPALILVFVLLFSWQAGAMNMNASYILPSPSDIMKKMWELRGILFGVHLPATLGVTLLGLFISVLLGLGLTIVMDAFSWVYRAVYPIVIISQTIPTTAIAPLFVLWFGYGIWSKVLVTILITFFPVVITVYDGFRAVPAEQEQLLYTFGAKKADVFIKLKLPATLPYFFSALKMAIPLSIIGAAIGEWLGAQSGLGYFSRRMMTQLDGAGVFAPIVLLAVIALLLVGMVVVIEKIAVKR